MKRFKMLHLLNSKTNVAVEQAVGAASQQELTEGIWGEKTLVALFISEQKII